MMDSIFIKMGNMDTKTDTQWKDNVKTHRKKGSRDQNDGSIVQGTLRTADKYQKLRRRKKGLSPAAIKENMTLQTFGTSSLYNREASFCGFKPSSFGYIH